MAARGARAAGRAGAAHRRADEFRQRQCGERAFHKLRRLKLEAKRHAEIMARTGPQSVDEVIADLELSPWTLELEMLESKAKLNGL